MRPFVDERAIILTCSHDRTLNVFAVRWYGEAEFWLALGKVLLSIGLTFYTFIVMLGGSASTIDSASDTGMNPMPSTSTTRPEILEIMSEMRSCLDIWMESSMHQKDVNKK